MQQKPEYKRRDFLSFCCFAPLSASNMFGKCEIWRNKTLNGNVLWVESQVPVNVGEKSESLEGYTFSLEPPEGGFTVHLLTLEPGFNGGNHQTKTIDLVFIQRAKPFSVGDNHQATSRFYIP